MKEFGGFRADCGEWRILFGRIRLKYEGGTRMPELPEVETMVRGLRPALEGGRLRRLEVLDASLVHGCSADELTRFGRGRRSARWVGGASGSS